MTGIGLFSWITGALQLVVPSYALRLIRRFGTQRVGWYVVLAFVLMRRSSPANVSAAPLGQVRSPQQGDSSAARRARIEELAATAGILGGLLDQYLSSRFYHLLLIYENAPSLQKRLSEVEGEYAAVSFFYFCKLISLLAECESEGGAIPLLSSQVAHDSAQRLMNCFLSSIPQGEEEESVDTFEIATRFREYRSMLKSDQSELGIPGSQVGEFVRRVDPKRYVSEDTSGGKVEELLVKEFAPYEKWLTSAKPGLILGAEALTAFYKLVLQDLRGLGGHHRRGSFSTQRDVADSAAILMLSDKLTAIGVEEVLSASLVPRPIGVYLRKAPLRNRARLIPQASPVSPPIVLTEKAYIALLDKTGTRIGIDNRKVVQATLQQHSAAPES